MRFLLIIAAMAVAACTPSEEEVLTMSVDVDQVNLAAFLGDVDALTDNALPVEHIQSFALATPMDQETQERFDFEYGGRTLDVQIHVWREQVDWLHLYFSSTSGDLIADLESTGRKYARSTDP